MLNRRHVPRTTTIALACVLMLVAGACATEPGGITRFTPDGQQTVAKPPPSRSALIGAGRYPWHTNITATTFWVGEIYNASLADGSQVCSTYDGEWAYRWSGINAGRVPSSAPGCAGAILGGCDGVGGYQNCQTEKRTAANDYFPTQVTPRENPFYLDLPYDDINDPIGFAQRCQVIPWANDPGYAGKCKDKKFSYMKNRWVEIVGPNGKTCYGQVQDAGPSSGSEYHDAAYVFGSDDARPKNKQWGNAGMDVSPALTGCLGFPYLNGTAKVNWRFVDSPPTGPWTRIITTSQVNW